jgi:hypothetical protein
VIDIADYKATIRLAVELVKRLTAPQVRKLSSYL